MIAACIPAILTLALGLAAAQAPIRFTTLARGDHSGIDRPRQVVVRTAAEWKALWRQHDATATPPPVDFARSAVIAVFAGSRPTAGYGVEITRIETAGTGSVVTYRERQPAPDDVVAQVLTTPFDIVRTNEKITGPVVFRHAQ